MGTSVAAAQKRESAEREGSRSRSRPGHERTRKGLEVLVKLLHGAFSTDGVTEKINLLAILVIYFFNFEDGARHFGGVVQDRAGRADLQCEHNGRFLSRSTCPPWIGRARQASIA